MRRKVIISAVLASVLCVQSCGFVSPFFHDDDVVAKVGRKKLYRSEVEALIPAGTSTADSLSIATRYINTWASDLVYFKVAEEKLPMGSKNLTKEVEQYRNALLKYRYEQMYVNEHLDTTVTPEQILEYYEGHQQSLLLAYPIVKARFIRLAPGAVSGEKVRTLLSSDDPEDQMELDNVVYSCSEKYNEFGGKWIEITALAREFGTDYGTLLSRMNGSFVEMDEPDGHVNMAYISNFMRSGSVPPVEFCRDKIGDVIISMRKQTLLADLEQELLKEARETGLFETFEDDEK